MGVRPRPAFALGALLTVAMMVCTTTTAAAAVRAQLTITTPPIDRIFTPNGDGWDDTQSFAWQLSAPASVTVEIRDATGAAVRSLLTDEPAGTEVSVAWDGLDGTGTLAPEGLYDVSFTARDAAGVVAAVTTRTGIRLQVPGTWTAPTAGSTMSGTADLVVTPTAGFDVTHVGFFVPEYSICCWDGTRAADGTWHYTLDTVRERSGEHTGYAYLAWTDELGAKHSYLTPTVTYSIANPLRIALTPRSEVFSPDGDGYEDTQAYYWDVSGEATATAQIRDATGAFVRSLPVTDSWHIYFGATWDGLDEAGDPVPDGVYTMVFTAQDAHGSIAEGTAPIGVRRGAPATWTAPADGATVTGPTDLVVAAAPWATIEQARFQPPTAECCALDGTRTDDDTWHYLFDTRTVVDGASTSYFEVDWTDEFGGVHLPYRSPTVTLTVDNTADNVPAPWRVKARTAPAAGVGSGEVRLSWQQPGCHGPRVVDYVIQVSVNPLYGWRTVDDGVSARTGATIRGLTNESTYVIRVAAVTSAGTGAWSRVVSAVPHARP